MRSTMTMKKSRILAMAAPAAAWFLVCGAGSVLARPVDERRAAAADARITIENVNGTITIEGWSKKEVHVTGTIGDDVEKLAVEGSDRRIRIGVELPRRSRNSRADADLHIMVPAGAEVLVDVVNCPIDVTKVEGSLELESVNGDITIAGKPSRIKASTVNGDIEVTASSNRVEVGTVNGRILLEGVSGEVRAGTVGGSIDIRGGRFDNANFETVSGDIDFAGELQSSGHFDFEAHSGDVILILPADVSAEFDVSTFSGDIDNDFGPQGRRTSEYGPGRELFFSTGGGKARVSINTFSGDVRLVKK